jgi:hypothetical protein
MFYFVSYDGHDGSINTCESREGSFDETALNSEFDTSGPPDWTPSYQVLEIDETTYDSVNPNKELYQVDWATDPESLPQVVLI